MTTIDSLLGDFWLATVAHLWQSTLVLAAIFLLSRAMRSAPARLLQVLWWSALVKLPHNPITGIGIGNTSDVDVQGLAPHNVVVQSYVEMGVLGLAGEAEALRPPQ